MKPSIALLALVMLSACGGDSGPSAPAGPDFGLAVSPATLTIVIGESDEYEITLTRLGGFAGDVTVTVVNLPRGVTFIPVTIPSGATVGTATVAVASSSEPGVFTLTVRGTAPGLTARSTDTVLVTRIVT